MKTLLSQDQIRDGVRRLADAISLEYEGVGYGLDYRDAYRNLPYVAALEAHELRGGE